MSNTISRATVMTLFCFSLCGCAVGIKSTSLKVAPSQPTETQLLKSAGYVFHDEIYAVRGRKQLSSEKKYIESERKSWVDALSGFTSKENIFTMSDGNPVSIINPPPATAEASPAQPPSLTDQGNASSVPESNATSVDSKPISVLNPFTEFAKTHPIVHVYVKAVPEKQGLAMDDMVYGTFWVTFLSFGITPAYLPIPYTASFTLSMPEEMHVPPAHWDYLYDRQEFYWLPLLIPMSGYLESLNSDDDADIPWKTEEKRRLLLRFLQDAKPLLQDIAIPK